MSLFHHTVRIVKNPFDHHQVITTIDYHIEQIKRELMTEEVLQTKLRKYIKYLERAKRIYSSGTMSGSTGLSAELRKKYLEQLNKALTLSTEIEDLLENSKLSDKVKDKWIRLIAENGNPYLRQ